MRRREMAKAGKPRQENMFVHDASINFRSTPPFSHPKSGEKGGVKLEKRQSPYAV